MKFNKFTDTESNLLAGLIFWRFRGDEKAAREAWKRLLQNPGWDETPDGRAEFSQMIHKGLHDLRRLGLHAVKERSRSSTARQSPRRLLADIIADTGFSIGELFGDRWDSSDPLATSTHNRNTLAWFGFEETAQRICGALELEV